MDHIDNTLAKCNQRLYLLYQFRTFGPTTVQLEMFFRCFLLSVMIYGCQVFYRSLSSRDKSRLPRVVKRARMECDVYGMFDERTLTLARGILKDSSHVMQPLFLKSTWSRRFLVPKCKTERFRKCFIFQATKFLNTK